MTLQADITSRTPKLRALTERGQALAALLASLLQHGVAVMPAMVFFELFSNNPNIVRIDAGYPLFAEGEEGHVMFVLTTGSAEVIVKGRVVEMLQRGNIVGEMGLVSPGQRSATVVTVTDCTPPKVLSAAATSNPGKLIVSWRGEVCLRAVPACHGVLRSRC